MHKGKDGRVHQLCGPGITTLQCRAQKVLVQQQRAPSRVEKKKVDVADIPNGYTSDVVLSQQARVAHGSGMADCLPSGPVAGKPMADTGHRSLW
jgi:hypothetical protein